MSIVYAWPPVGRIGFSWVAERPVNMSRSILTGARYVSGAQRKRRYATVTVGNAGRDAAGMGYLAVLRELLDGGINLVRLNRLAPTGWVDAAALAGRVLPAVGSTVGGQPQVAVTGGPASTIIARPGEMVTLYVPFGGTVGTSAMVQTLARTDGSGAAVIKVMTALTGTGRAEFGTPETGVFEVTDMPADSQPLSGDWSVTWSFAEVFADEVGAFTEVNPW